MWLTMIQTELCMVILCGIVDSNEDHDAVKSPKNHVLVLFNMVIYNNQLVCGSVRWCKLFT